MIQTLKAARLGGAFGPPDELDEAWYLQANPDVREAIAAGKIKSARHHYERHGRREGRRAAPPPEADLLAEAEAALAREQPHHVGANFLTPRALQSADLLPRRMLLVGSCQLDELGFHADEEGPVPADYILLNEPGTAPAPPRDLSEYDLQISQIALRTIMRDGRLWTLDHSDLAAHERLFEEAVAALRSSLETHLAANARTGLLTFVFGFAEPQQNPMGRLMPRFDLRNPCHFVRRLNEEMERICLERRNVYVVDLDRIWSSLGRRYIQDDHLLALTHAGFLGADAGHTDRVEPTPALYLHYPRQVDEAREALWAEIVAMYRTARQADAVKLVVVDLDDTLWNGVAAEMDYVGPELTEGWPLGMVEALAYLKKRGVLLALLSKNDEARIEQIWARVYGPFFPLSMFAVRRVNWRPKTENMAEILQAVNLLPRSVVYVDDHPAERAAMQRAFPEMRVLDGRHYYWRKTLLWSPETQVAFVSAESERRTQMIQAQGEREAARQGRSEAEFLAEQQLRIDVERVLEGRGPYARALELLNKTNQFNTTGERWSAEAFAAFARRHEVYAFTAADRFTPYGVVGVVLVEDATIRQVVMSCRVVGRQVEIAALAAILGELGARGPVRALTKETPANLLSRDLFERMGFVREGEAWVLRGEPTPAPAFIRCEVAGAVQARASA